MKKKEIIDLARKAAVMLSEVAPSSSAKTKCGERLRIHRYCYGAACALGILVVAAKERDDTDVEDFVSAIISAAIDYDAERSELEVFGDEDA